MKEGKVAAIGQALEAQEEPADQAKSEDAAKSMGK
jgi:hypothetical protein